MKRKNIGQEQEVWKSIKGYKFRYEVSTWGNIRNLDTKKTLKLYINKNGYKITNLQRVKGVETVRVHRVVAKAFLRNPELKRTVNHIDGNPSNNNVSNLEWATDSENLQHSYTFLGRKGAFKGKFGEEHPGSRPVKQYTKNGIFIANHNGLLEAQRNTGVFYSNISKVLSGDRNTAGGFIWKE